MVELALLTVKIIPINTKRRLKLEKLFLDKCFAY